MKSRSRYQTLSIEDKSKIQLLAAMMTEYPRFHELRDFVIQQHSHVMFVWRHLGNGSYKQAWNFIILGARLLGHFYFSILPGNDFEAFFALKQQNNSHQHRQQHETLREDFLRSARHPISANKVIIQSNPPGLFPTNSTP